MFIVARPDGSTEEFATVDEATAVQSASPGSQLRTTTKTSTVPGEYVVVDADEAEIDRFDSAVLANRCRQSNPGSEIRILPKE